MMHRRFIILAAIGCLASALAAPVWGQTPVKEATPAQASALLQAAQQKAKKQHKAVWVMFHASW